MIKKTKQINSAKINRGTLQMLTAPVPEFLYLALTNTRCPKGEWKVKEGDHVNLHQVIGVRHASFFDQNIHATCSGTVVGFEKHYHRSGKQVEFVKIQNDFEDTKDTSCVERSNEDIAKLTKEEMTDIIKDCSCVGLGGSSFPTYVKFQTDRPIKTILINGIECEPGIDADQRLMREEADQLLKGIQYIMQAFKCNDARICIKKKHKDLGDYLEAQCQKPEFVDSHIQVSRLGNFYPEGWEVDMIRNATGIKVESGHLPSEYGIINFNVATTVGIYEAIKFNMPVYERNITISGDGIKNPADFRVRVGSPLQPLLEACGGFIDETPKDVILGGPMMGECVTSTDLILTKTVTSIFVINHEVYEEQPCIRCGSCILSCPVELSPMAIMNTMNTMPVDKAKIKALHPERCIGCGLCTYSCTSKIEVKEFVKRAKLIARLP